MRKTKLTLLLLAALLAGVCIGFFTNSAIIRSRIRHYSRIPENLPEHIAQRLTVRLELDEEQQQQVRAVLISYNERMKEAREQSNALLDSVLEDMRGEISGHLRPDQLEQYKVIVEERRRIRQERGELLSAFPPPRSDKPGNGKPGNDK